MKPYLFALLFIAASQLSLAQSKEFSLQAEVPANLSKKKVVVNYIGSIGTRGRYDAAYKKADELTVNGQRVTWRKKTNEPLYFYADDLVGKNTVFFYMIEPGDHILVQYKNGQRQFLGKGAEKFALGQRLQHINDSLERLPIYSKRSNASLAPSSAEDYFLWNDMLNKKLEVMVPLIEYFKPRMSSAAYNNIKVRTVSNIEKQRIDKFFVLRGQNSKVEYGKNANGETVNGFGLSENDLSAIYDTTLNNSWSKWLFEKVPVVFEHDYYQLKLRMQANRSLGNFFTANSKSPLLTRDSSSFWVLLAEMAKKQLSGIRREAVLASLLMDVRGAFYYCMFTPQIESLLADYYRQSVYPEYASLVKQTELSYRERYARKFGAPFSLTTTTGGIYTNRDLLGKVAILDFWFTGCTGCVQMAPVLRQVESAFKNDTNVVFLSISIDKNKATWLKSIKEKKYTTGDGINLYTGGQGANQDIIAKYGVSGYPSIYVIDHLNKVTWNVNIPDPRKDGGKKLIKLIQNKLAVSKDGPYVFHGKNETVAFAVNGHKVSSIQLDGEHQKKLQVQTDEYGKSFSVRLRKSLSPPPVTYVQPDRLLALSDIEGNFDAFRKLLQANGVIDENYHWNFGNGHLVFSGDMFDRGLQVTECLWLIYSLEEQAEAAGGFVHFILGNHEILNLKGNDKYVQQKYQENASLMNKRLIQLYDGESELGRWLRTKNIMEKIGGILFLHGGISPQMNELPLTVDDINKLAKPYYAILKKDYGNDHLNTILSDRVGPYWYRGYYEDKSPEAVINTTLKKFEVNHIVTGHTIIADTISMHYNGKVFNTDVHHAEGKIEALLIEGDKFYRVNDKGERHLLFTETDEQWKTPIKSN